MKMLLGDSWVEREERIDILNPFDNSVVDSVPSATLNDVESAIVAAQRGARLMRELTGYQRYEILQRVAELMRANIEDLARTITLEQGKTLRESHIEVERATEIIVLSAEEAKRLAGEVIPLDGAPGVAGKLGFTLRVPCGVVVAISPFNFPLHLVCHKIGPAFAAGNACILKPATETPLSALKVTELFLRAGAPAEALQCITGPGGAIGGALCSDSRVRKISFTGSRDVGEQITRIAGLKRVTMELGSNSPLIVMPDADPELVAQIAIGTSFANAGQACISTQRIIAHREIYVDLLDALGEATAPLQTGDPLDETTNVGPMIRAEESMRVADWVNKATSDGARVLVGGERDGALFSPTVVADVHPGMRLSCDEVFGPSRGGDPGKGPGCRNRAGQCNPLWIERRNFHPRHRYRNEICPRMRVGQSPRQLGHPVARGFDAVRRPQGKRLWQGRSTLCHPGDDRTEDGRVSHPAAVIAYRGSRRNIPNPYGNLNQTGCGKHPPAPAAGLVAAANRGGLCSEPGWPADSG